MTTMASQVTSLTVVYSTVYSDADQRKHQSSASLAFVWGNHRDRWIPRTKGQLRGKCFHLMTSSCDQFTHHPRYVAWIHWLISGGHTSYLVIIFSMMKLPSTDHDSETPWSLSSTIYLLFNNGYIASSMYLIVWCTMFYKFKSLQTTFSNVVSLNENGRIPIKILLKYLPNVPINNILTLV